MIKIEVTSCNDTPSLQPLAAEFDELGGNIGRAEGNTLVLHDPERHISRIHASILFRNGQYFIRSLGSASPVYLNDQPLNNGQDASISFGDNIRIDGYLMRVVNEEAIDPLNHDSGAEQEADPFGIFDTPADNNSLSEILATPTAESLQDHSAPKEIIPNTQIIDNANTSSVGTAAEALGIIPPDFNPFDGNSSSSDALSSGIEPSTPDQNINEIITPDNSYVELPDKSNAESVDPMVLLGGESSNKDCSSKPDNVAELHAPFQQPKVEVFAHDEPPAIDTKEEKIKAPVQVQSSAKQDELLHAFLAGAGMPDLEHSTELTPELMGRIGQLLRESTQGTLDLLTARALTKQEMRAEVTMIAPRKNNPLKFSPNIEAALTHLLAPKGRGFLAPQAAMKDAYDDLRAHQFGFMAGMRAALTSVLDRFCPQKLEERLVDKTILDNLFQGNRKAKLWDLFTERYSDISTEAEEDFHALFGREFLRAYEAQIAKLEQDDKRI